MNTMFVQAKTQSLEEKFCYITIILYIIYINYEAYSKSTVRLAIKKLYSLVLID